MTFVACWQLSASIMLQSMPLEGSQMCCEGIGQRDRLIKGFLVLQAKKLRKIPMSMAQQLVTGC